MNTLILLVGANPLPNYLAACALQPACVALVYTRATKDAKDRLRDALKHVLGDSARFEEPLVEDATSATRVRRVVDPLVRRADGGVFLNYTGGTKVMAAHARLAFYEAQGKPQHASYLDEGGVESEPCLRFDDGTSKPLSTYENVPLTLDTVLALHGITRKLRKVLEPAPSIDDAREILCKVLADPNLANRLYDERKRLEKFGNPMKAGDEPFRADRYGLTLSVPVFPTSEQLASLANRNEKESWFKQWYEFIGGGWLEQWVAEQVRQIGLQPQPEVAVGFDAFRGPARAQLEMDVAVIRGHRSYFISCTTDRDKGMCKLKLFEVAVRSQQLGGDLARAALACLADDQTASKLQADIDDVWGAKNTTKVFGISDLRAWSDCGGKPSNRHSLKEWLES